MASPGTTREYKNGRDTDGWAQTNKVRAISDVAAGDILVALSHRFQAQNLVKVVRIAGTPDRLDSPNKFYICYSDIAGNVNDPREMCVWEHELAPSPEPSDEYFKARFFGESD